MYKASDINTVYIDVLVYLYPIEIYKSMDLVVNNEVLDRLNYNLLYLEEIEDQYNFSRIFNKLVSDIIYNMSWTDDRLIYADIYAKLRQCLFNHTNLEKLDNDDLYALYFIEGCDGWVVPNYILPCLPENNPLYHFIEDRYTTVEAALEDTPRNYYSEYLYQGNY